MTAQKNRLFDLVDKAPFSGKFIIKDTYLEFLEAPDESKTKHMIGTSALLGFMVAAHAYQAKIGYDALTVHAPLLAEDPSIKNALMTTIDVSYAGAMAAVTARQTALSGKVAQKYLSWRSNKKHGCIQDDFERRDDYPTPALRSRAMAIAVGATLTGQALGLYSMLDAKNEQLQSTAPSITQEYTHPVDPIDDNVIVIRP